LRQLVAPAVKAFAASPLGWRALGRFRRPGLLVLTYHRIPGPEDRFPGLAASRFAEQMRWVATRCRPVSAQQALEAIQEPPDPRPPVLVTFDDGYLDFKEHAHPILEELGIPCVVFLATAYIDDPVRLFWWDALRQAVEQTPLPSIELPWRPGRRLPVDSHESRESLIRAAKDHLKEQAHASHEATLAELLSRLGTSMAALRGVRQMMDWDDVRELAGSVHFGGHTHTHPILSAVTEERVDAEISTCRERIRTETGLEPRWFAYPNGRARDFDARTQSALRRHGFEIAVTTEEGVNGPDTERLALRRFAGGTTVSELAWRLSVHARH
jgi:peptidoglycan/xylan/chitin deacetylase (PgdA/CDA1 family)